MWLLPSVLGLFCYLSYELLAKRAVEHSGALAPYRIKLAILLEAFVAVILLWLFDIGESGLAPWEIIVRHPSLILSALCAVAAELTFLLSLRYIGISVQNAVYGLNAPVLFLAVILVNLFGGLSSVQTVLTPVRLLPIVLLVLGLFLLPNIEWLFAGKSRQALTRDRKKMCLGIAVAFCAVLLEVGSTVCSMLLLDGVVDTFDYLSGTYFVSVPASLVLFAFARTKSKEEILFTKASLPAFGIAVLFLLHTVCYVKGMAMSPVNAGLLWVIYPVLPVLCSRIFLKETYTWRQYACIVLALVSAAVFCVQDILR